MMSKKSKFVCKILILMAFPSCGPMAPEFLAKAQDPLPVIRLANPKSENLRVKSVPGSYLVMFRKERLDSNLFFSSFADEYAHHYASLSEDYLADSRVKSIDVLASVDLSSSKTADWEPDFSIPKALASLTGETMEQDEAGVMARVDFSDESSAASALDEWNQSGKIWYAEPNEISRFSVADPSTKGDSNNDLSSYGTTYASLQPWHEMIYMSKALTELGAGTIKGAASPSEMIANKPIIAVMDSGTDYEHEQLKDSIWENSSVGSAGCTGDVHGCNTTAPSKGSLGNGEVWPVGATKAGESCGQGEDAKCDHGTHVAGIVAAKPKNSSKVAGSCPICQVMILRVGEIEAGDTSADPQIKDDSQIRALKYLARFRKSGGSAVRIVNASLGKYSRSRSIAILVDVLKKVGTGTLVIAAASNEDSMIRAYPAALANVIAVSAVNPDASKAPFSNFGPWVDVAAPGVDIESTLSGNRSGVKQGTSMASPVVAGAAGLLLAAFPNLSFNELRDRILTTADSKLLYGADSKGGALNAQYYYPQIQGESARRPLLGGGVVNVYSMLTNASSSATGQPLDRVTAGCGTIGATTSHYGAMWNLALMVVPIVLTLVLTLGLRRRR